MAREEDDYRERARKRAGERQDSAWYKLKGAVDEAIDNTFRILRTPKSKKTPGVWYEYNIHRDIGPKKMRVRCGKDINGEGECWLCDVQMNKLVKAGREARAGALQPTLELVFQVAKVTDEGKMIGPKLFSPAKTLGDQLLTQVLGSKRRDYVDPEKGYNLTVSRKGTGRNDTRYTFIGPDEDPSEVPESIMAKLKPFSEVKEIPVYSEDRQKAAYFGREVDDDEDEDSASDDEDEKPRRRQVQPDDDDDNDTSDDDDEPPKKPAKKKPEPEPDEDEPPKKRAKKPEPDEDDEPPKKPAKKKPEPEPDEDDDLDLDGDDTSDDDDLDLDDDDDKDNEPDEDDEPPKKPGKKKPEPDDDDDEPPKKSGKRAPAPPLKRK